MNYGTATGTKLTDYIMYKYTERIKEKNIHDIECYPYHNME